ncbi:MAG: silent information regulator protein Sir2 [Armatimonadota bacterium]
MNPTVVTPCLILACCLAATSLTAAERLDRGLVALPTEDGVYLGWRLLADDPPDVAFTVFRRAPDERNYKRLNQQPLTASTNHLDTTAERDTTYSYCVVTRVGGKMREHAGPVQATAGADPKPYVTIPFQGDYRAQKVGIGDLDGDGQYEYVIKQPDFNTDPYQQPGYWKQSEDTYKLEAYKQDGTLMWRHDMGWSIEEGIWYSPYIVYDLDGDGKAEVITKAGEGDPREPEGHVKSGPEYLMVLDGETGRERARTDWLSRDGFESYNYYCRNFLAIAYLDGQKPSIIMQRGTYTIIKIAALDADLNQIWYWEASGDDARFRGQGAHTLQPADIDGDGRDELVIGSGAIDDDGKALWCTGLRHPDGMHVADIDPDRPGLEVFYGIEPGRKENAVCLVDARTGEILWGYVGQTRHVHGQGMCADIIPDAPGMECYAGEKDGSNYWLYSAKGEVLSKDKLGGLAPPTAYWDARPQKEIVLGGKIQQYQGEQYARIEGRIIAIADVLGDWREEIIASVNGELRLYTTTIPADTRRVCLMQNHLYRMGAATQSMGYWSQPQEGPQ